MSLISENNALIAENKRLTIRLAASEAKQKAIVVEREFWVEQGRNLQNALQTSQRMYSNLYDQLGHGVVTDQSIADNLALASQELCQPLTSVEAIRALTSSMEESTQGNYTARNTGKALDQFTAQRANLNNGRG